MENTQIIVDSFEIPKELAKELSELLTKQTVRERVLINVIEDPVKYLAAEELLLPIVSKIETIKYKVTNEYVPEKYRHNDYIWNYDGYEISGNRVDILRNV